MKRSLVIITILLMICIVIQPISTYAAIKIQKNSNAASAQSLNKLNLFNLNKINYKTKYFDITVNKRFGKTIVKPLGNTSIKTINLIKPGSFFSYSNDREFELLAGTIEYVGDLSVYGSNGKWAILYDSLYKEYHVVIFTFNYCNYKYLSNISWNNGEGINVSDNIQINRIALNKDDAFGEYGIYRQAPVEYLFGLYSNYEAPIIIANWENKPDSLLIFVHDNY